jgi:DNA-binding winged helix-turn-helix (wHTH) protein
MSLRFGDFVLDSGARQLWRGREERHLGPKAFELLELLLRNRPNVLSKDRLHDHLWPGTFVSGSTLATVVGEIRAALDDDAASPRFLRTVHGVGYAFCGEASEEGSASAAAETTLVSYRIQYEDREIALRPCWAGSTKASSGSTRRGSPADTRGSASTDRERCWRTWTARTGRTAGASASRPRCAWRMVTRSGWETSPSLCASGRSTTRL